MELLTVIGYSREMEEYLRSRLISFSVIYTIFGFYGNPYLIHSVLKPMINDNLHTADCKSLYQFMLNQYLLILRNKTKLYFKEGLSDKIDNYEMENAMDYITDCSKDILVSCSKFNLDNKYQRNLFLPSFEFFQSLITETFVIKNDICMELRNVLIDNIPKPNEILTEYEPELQATEYINKLILLLAEKDKEGMKRTLSDYKPIGSSYVG